MEIKDLNGLGLPKRIERNPSDKVQPKKAERKESDTLSSSKEGDQVEISDKAREVQKSDNELQMAKELLSELPSERAHVVYEALAKLKAGVYSDDQIIAEATSRLLDSDELRDLL